MDWEYVALEEVDFEGSFVVAGLPSVKFVGPLAAAFLTDHLDMRVVGAFQSDALPPVASVRGGLVTSPVQVWATELACGLDGKCDRLVVVKSDIPLAPEQLAPFAGALAHWAAQRRVKVLLALDTYPHARDDGKPGLIAAASRFAGEYLAHLPATPIENALITGFTGVVLVRANRHRLAAVGLFAPAEEEGAHEPTLAARLLGTIGPLIPHIDLQADELAKRAGELESAMKADHAQQQGDLKRLADAADPSYL